MLAGDKPWISLGTFFLECLYAAPPHLDETPDDMTPAKTPRFRVPKYKQHENRGPVIII